MMGFERFDARTRSYRNETRATVGISKAGRVSLNVMASRALKDPERVFLSFDDEGRRIGITQTPPDDPSSFKVAWPGKGVVRISYRAFLRHFGVLVEKAQRSPARYETDGGGMLVVELRDRPNLKERVLGQIEREEEANGYSASSRQTGGRTRGVA